jgi:hypothetical protein
MNSSRFPFTTAAAALILFALPHNTAAQVMGGTAITGDYKAQVTGDVFLTGTVHLTQQGTRIVGSAPAKGGGTLQFSGTLQNEKLSGTWRSPSNETGWLTFFFTQNGKGFDGEWGFHGAPPNGSVVGTRSTG